MRTGRRSARLAYGPRGSAGARHTKPTLSLRNASHHYVSKRSSQSRISLWTIGFSLLLIVLGFWSAGYGASVHITTYLLLKLPYSFLPNLQRSCSFIPFLFLTHFSQAPLR
jgi:hypothetical protein